MYLPTCSSLNSPESYHKARFGREGPLPYSQHTHKCYYFKVEVNFKKFFLNDSETSFLYVFRANVFKKELISHSNVESRHFCVARFFFFFIVTCIFLFYAYVGIHQVVILRSLTITKGVQCLSLLKTKTFCPFFKCQV